MTTIRALTLDLDDTLWPIGPTIRRAHAAVRGWFEANAPELARWGDDAWLLVQREVIDSAPHKAHDLRWRRARSYALALERAGYDANLSGDAFAVFDAARHDVELFPDVEQALTALARTYPLVALSNGSAQVERAGLGNYFVGAISAVDLGVAKPDPGIFHAACKALRCEPCEVLHVGDDVAFDVLGALDAGLLGAWINRDGAVWSPSRQPTVTCTHLGELVTWLEDRESGGTDSMPSRT